MLYVRRGTKREGECLMTMLNGQPFDNPMSSPGPVAASVAAVKDGADGLGKLLGCLSSIFTGSTVRVVATYILVSIGIFGATFGGRAGATQGPMLTRSVPQWTSRW